MMSKSLKVLVQIEGKKEDGKVIVKVIQVDR